MSLHNDGDWLEFHNRYNDWLLLVANVLFYFWSDQMPTAPILASCLSKLITENILPYACNVKGEPNSCFPQHLNYEKWLIAFYLCFKYFKNTYISQL